MSFAMQFIKCKYYPLSTYICTVHLSFLFFIYIEHFDITFNEIEINTKINSLPDFLGIL